jgi:hypothetical protein
MVPFSGNAKKDEQGHNYQSHSQTVRICGYRIGGIREHTIRICKLTPAFTMNLTLICNTEGD